MTRYRVLDNNGCVSGPFERKEDALRCMREQHRYSRAIKQAVGYMILQFQVDPGEWRRIPVPEEVC